MPEDMNIEFAQQLNEQAHEHAHGRHTEARSNRVHQVLEIAEVLVLAVVAVATAWTGFQAAKWDGQESVLYGDSSTLRTQASTESALGAQLLAANASIFTAWLQARFDNRTELMADLERRFSPDYKAAFDAWLKTDPFTNPDAPPGPGYMKDYRSPHFAEADRLNTEADHTFEEGTHARHTAETYVRDTVLFASVLFLVAISQRSKSHIARLIGNFAAVAVLVYVLLDVTGLPRV
jgi:hypothetical protein